MKNQIEIHFSIDLVDHLKECFTDSSLVKLKKITHHATNYTEKTVHPRRSQPCTLPALDWPSRRPLASYTPAPLPHLAMGVGSGRRKKQKPMFFFAFFYYALDLWTQVVVRQREVK